MATRALGLALGYLACGPLLLLIGQKLARLAALSGTPAPLALLRLLTPDLLFALGAGALAWGTLAAVPGRRSRALALLVLQVALTLVVLASTASHRYFLTTGTPLDYPMFRLGLVELDERARVASSEIPWSTWLACALAIGTSLALPWRALRTTAPGRVRGPAGAVGALVMLPLGALGITASGAVAPPAGVGADFARPPVVNLALTTLVDDPTSAALLSAARAAPRGAARLVVDESGRDEADERDAPERKNLLFILLESTGARATSAYEPTLTTTPALARWARRGTLVEQAHAVVPHTSKALVAILCGFAPRVGVRITEALPGGLPGRCVPDLLREHGYRTAFMQSARGSFEQRGALVAALGFERFEHSGTLPTAGFERANYFAHEDEIMRAPARAFMADPDERPFVLTLLTGATHHDYREVRRHGTQVHDAEDPTRNRWLNAVRRQDHFMDGVLRDLEAAGRLDDTLVVIVGDHGEAFGEHGLRTHDEVPYEEVLHVPIVILDGEAPGRVRGPVTQLDIAPTVIERLGFAPLGGRYAGLPLRASMPLDRPLYAGCYHELRCAVELVGSRKLVHRYGVLPDQLFDLSEDPLERRDLLADPAPEVLAYAEEARARARRWVEVTNLTSQTTAGIERAVDAARVDALPRDARPVTGRFGDHVRVLGVAYPDAPPRRTDYLDFTVYYQVLEPLPPRFRLVQTGRGEGTRTVSYTHTPVGGLYPAALWKPGEIIADAFSLRIVPHHEGDYLDVSVAFRSEDGGESLPVSEGESRHPGELFLARVPIAR